MKGIFKRKPVKFGKLFKQNWQYTLMSLPIVIKIVVFSVLPMIWMLMAFQDYTSIGGLFGSEWVGISNFAYFFKSNKAWILVRNTIGLNALFIGVGTPVTILLALLLFEVKRKRVVRVFQTIYFFPYLISWVVVANFTSTFFGSEGLINNFITMFGGTAVSFYAESNAQLWPFILLACNFWKCTGYSMIMYYAALSTVDTELFEAADVEGAGRFQKMWHISLPHLRKTITILFIMSMGGIFRSDFGLFYFIPKNDSLKTLLSTTEVMDTYIYAAMKTSGFSVSTAIGLFQSAVGTITLLIANAVARKIDKESAFI